MTMVAKLILGGILGCLLGPLNTSAASVVFSDDFDAEAYALGVTGNFGNWTVISGDIDVIGPGFHDVFPGSGRYLDMGGYSNGSIELSGALPLAPGQYALSFDIGYHQSGNYTGNVLEYRVGSLLAGTVAQADYPAGATTAVPLSFSFTVPVATSVVLGFAEIGATDDASGTMLDNVSLTRVSAVPLQASALLLASGLPGLGAVESRRHHVSGNRV